MLEQEQIQAVSVVLSLGPQQQQQQQQQQQAAAAEICKVGTSA
jgi:hypothetical protein